MRRSNYQTWPSIATFDARISTFYRPREYEYQRRRRRKEHSIPHVVISDSFTLIIQKICSIEKSSRVIWIGLNFIIRR